MNERLNKFFHTEEGELNMKSCIVRSIFTSMPNIADFVLSIISYYSKIKAYFILRFISQFFNMLVCISFALVLSYQTEDQYDGCCYVVFFLVVSIIFLGMELTSLVFFIVYYSDIEKIGDIGYFIHLLLIPLIALNMFITKKYA